MIVSDIGVAAIIVIFVAFGCYCEYKFPRYHGTNDSKGGGG